MEWVVFSLSRGSSQSRNQTQILGSRQILDHLSLQESPKILEKVAYPFSSGSSNPGIQPGSPALQEDSLPAEGAKMSFKSITRSH